MAGSDATSVSTGNRTILGRITKRGNRYLRMLFAQGARAILLRPMSWAKHSFGPWLTTLLVAVLVTSLNRMSRHAMRMFSSWEHTDTLVFENLFWEEQPRACFRDRRFLFFSRTESAPAQC